MKGEPLERLEDDEGRDKGGELGIEMGDLSERPEHPTTITEPSSESWLEPLLLEGTERC